MAIRKVNTAMPEYLRLWIFGVGGSGKTRLCASAALDDRTYPTLMLNFAGNPVSFTDYVRQPDVIELASLDDINIVYAWLVNKMPTNHPLVTELKLRTDYKCIVIDTTTELQRIAFNEILKIEKHKPGNIPPAIEIQHYGRALAMLTTFSRLVFGLSVHVIMTAQESERVKKSTQVEVYDPLVWGQGVREIAGYANAVGRLVNRSAVDSRTKQAIGEKPVKQNILLFTPEYRMPLLKDQYNRLAPMLIDPTVSMILDKVYTGCPPDNNKQ